MRLHIGLLGLFICIMSQLTSCGQAGNLYLPKKPPAQAETQVHE